MNKKDLCRAVKRGFPDSMDIVNEILLAMNTAFINKEKVTIPSFGTFKPYKSKVKQVKDWKTGEWYEFEGTWTIKFKLSPQVKKRMNQ